MKTVGPRVLLDYLAATAAVALALVLTVFLPPLRSAPSPLFFGAVMVSAWYGGMGPGLLATMLSALALDYYFLAPIYSLGMGLAESVRCIAFVSMAAMISSLNGARRRLEDVLRRRDRRKDEFLALLAHELRCPMDAISAALETLRRRAPEQRSQENALHSARRQVDTINRLVAELDDVAAVGRGRLRLFKTTVNVHEVVRQALETTSGLVQEKNHHLTVELPVESLCLEADPVRLEQILAELLTHCARYTPPGGKIQLRVERSGANVLFEVRDNGLGFTADVQPHVFDLFVRDGNGAAELGVCLHLVRRLVELHGGTATARSQGLHKGSQFFLRLPLGEVGPAATISNTPQGSAFAAATQTARSIAP